MRSPNILDTFVTVENEPAKSGSGISSETLPLSKSGVSSVVVLMGALVGVFGGDKFDDEKAERLLACKDEESVFII